VLALQSVDTPSLATLQTLVNLTLYWFGAGEMVRAYMHHGILIRALHVLGLDKLEPGRESGSNWVHQEMKGRVFWAIWLIDSFATSKTKQDHMLVGDSITTPLPSSETEFSAKKRTSKPLRLTELGATESVMGELMRAARLWYSLNLINADCRVDIGMYTCSNRNNSTARILDLQALDSRALAWYAALHPTLKYNRENFSIHSRLESSPAFVLIHVVYHAALAVLYYSLVLSLASNPQSASSISVSLLTTSSLEHANAISDIVKDLLSPEWDTTRTPAFVSYAAYIATTVQLSYLWSHSSDLAAAAKENIVTNLKLMRDVGPYWAVAEQVVSYPNACTTKQIVCQEPNIIQSTCISSLS